MKTIIQEYRKGIQNRCNFRLAVELDCIAYESFLCRALEKVTPRFDHRANSRITFHLSCHSRRIVLDAYGADCNCDEAVVFLITLTAEYFRTATKENIECGGSVLDLNEQPSGNELVQGTRRIFPGGREEIEHTRMEIPVLELIETASAEGKTIWQIAGERFASATSKTATGIPETINLTVKDIPDSLQSHIKDFDFIAGRVAKKAIACTMLCYGNVMALNVSRLSAPYFSGFDGLEVLVAVQA